MILPKAPKKGSGFKVGVQGLQHHRSQASAKRSRASRPGWRPQGSRSLCCNRPESWTFIYQKREQSQGGGASGLRSS